MITIKCINYLIGKYSSIKLEQYCGSGVNAFPGIHKKKKMIIMIEIVIPKYGDTLVWLTIRKETTAVLS